MHDSTLHAKIFTVDGLYSSIGSFNFDLWSGRGNLETNIGVFDPDTTSVLDTQFTEDISRCKSVTLQQLQARSIWSKLLHWFSYWSLQCLSPPIVGALSYQWSRVKTAAISRYPQKSRPLQRMREVFAEASRIRNRSGFYKRKISVK